MSNQVKQSAKCEAGRILGRPQFFAVLVARSTIQWPPSWRCGRNRTQVFSRHAPSSGRPTQSRRSSTGLESGDCPSVATSHLHQILRPMYLALGPTNLRELGTFSRIMDQLVASQFGRATDVTTQRYKAIEMTIDGVWKRASHLELLPNFARRQASPHGERRTRVYHQGASPRDEVEKSSWTKAALLGRRARTPRVAM